MKSFRISLPALASSGRAAWTTHPLAIATALSTSGAVGLLQQSPGQVSACEAQAAYSRHLARIRAGWKLRRQALLPCMWLSLPLEQAALPEFWARRGAATALCSPTRRWHAAVCQLQGKSSASPKSQCIHLRPRARAGTCPVAHQGWAGEAAGRTRSPIACEEYAGPPPPQVHAHLSAVLLG